MEPPTGLIPWFSKTKGNTYATLLHHPSLFKGNQHSAQELAAAQTDIMRTLTRDWFYRRALHTGGWRVSVSPTLVEPSVATPGPCDG